MKKKFNYTERIGLPGGPNEYITHVSGIFSTEGYKRNSPDVNNPYNIIPSGDITMKGVDFPVIGTDNLGNTKAMIPGNDYQFPGDMVFETPMYKRGGGLLTKTMKCNSCGWKWKAADGGNDVSTCHKCGGEALPKAQEGDETKPWEPKPSIDPAMYVAAVKQFVANERKKQLTGAALEAHKNNPELQKKSKAEINKEWIKNWIKTRNATGKFESQLGDGQMEKGFKSLDDVKKVSREEMVKAGNDEASYWQFSAPDGMYVPSANIYFSDPRFFSINKEEDTDVHEQSHVFDIGTSGLPGKDMKESIPETNIHKAIKNIPVKGGYKTEEYLPPAEIYAELMKFRKKNNIDPNKIYTKDDLLELRKKLKEENEYGLFKLDDIYEDEEILRLMNEVATIDTPQENNIRYAEYGGSLPKAQVGGEYKVKSGDTFYGIANKNNISKEDLIKANPGIDIQNLKLNQTIKFPVQDNVQDNVQKPEETSWSDYLNPWNWGVSDRDDDGDFKQAFRAAREAGEDEFMWYGTRYTTDLKPTSAKNATVQVEKASDKLNKAVKTEPFDNYKITPQLLYKQAFVESRLNPKAKNSLGYMGLGQIGEGVIKDYKKATGVKEVDPFDPKQNHDIQEWSMNELYNASFIDKPGATAENRLIKALASYNYGRGKVKDILEAEKAKGNDIYKSNDWTKQLPKETREYIDMIVYDGVTEKRPDVQTNFKKATEEDGYKDLRELYKYQLKGEVPSKKTEDSKYSMFMDAPYLKNVGDKFVQEQRIVAQDNTRVSIPAINKDLVRINNLKKFDIDQGEYQFDIPTVAQDNTYLDPIKQIDYTPLTNEELDIAEREYKRPNLTSGFTEAVNDYKPKNKYEKDYTNASETEIKELQKTLIKEGYGSLLGDYGDNQNGVDGKFGPKTKAAYESLISAGDLGLNNIDKFYKKYSNNNKIPVKKLQAELVEKGYLSEKTKEGKTNIDGKFGDRTKQALQEYNSSINSEDPQSFIFNKIPNKLEDPRCAAGMCSILEDNNVITESLGIKYKNAWDIHENMMNTGNSKSIYNIYDEPEFATLGPDTSAEELKSITKKVKQRSQTKESDYAVGDIVGLYWPNSNYHEETLKNSKTFNTHVGFVSDFDKNGKPIITHNVNGNVLQQPYDQLQTTWISRPKENIKLNKKYDASEYQDVEINQNLLSNFEAKKERALSANEKDVVTNIMKRAKYNSQSIPEMLNSSVNKNWLEAATFAITGVESSAGISPNTPRTAEEAASQNLGLQGLAYSLKGKTPEDISLGVAKVKFNSLDNFAKEYFDIQSPEDLANDNKATDAASYLLVKHYELFKNYGEQYPEFGLTEEDFKNMAILAHNQGSNLLLKTGRNNLKSGTRSSEDQIESLRKLYQGNIKDVSSTKLNHLGILGELIYDLTEDEGSETYISKSNRYIDEVYNKNKKQYAGVNNNNTPSSKVMAKGGEYQIFNNYVNGIYDNTPKEKEAQKIYDKLNRVHYKDAKKAGTTVPNYILSVLMNAGND
jgi:LysM repeat protein